MNVNMIATSGRRDLYDQVAAITQAPLDIPLAEALKQIENCLEAGECLLACNACESLASVSPEHPRLTQLWALALARSGAANKANLMIAKLASYGDADEETLGILGRTWKDLWLQTGQAEFLAHARDTYLQSYALKDKVWSGINAATLALLSKDTAQAKRLAAEVLNKLSPLLAGFNDGTGSVTGDMAAYTSPSTNTNSQRYWDYASIGEAALILERPALAGWAYQNAMALSAGNLGNRASTKRNAELVLSVNDVGNAGFKVNFGSPQVVVFTGHMLDAPDRPQARFPAHAEKAVYQRMLATLAKWDAQIGFSAAAGGADILFLEALKELGAETNIVLPHPPELFFESSVGLAHGAEWLKRYERVLSDARQVTVLSDSVGDDVAFYFGGVVMAGLAKLRAVQVSGQLRGLTVWDMKSGLIGGTGGTASDWLSRGLSVDRLSPAIDDDQLIALDPSQGFGVTETLLQTNPQKVIFMLFADAAGFSKFSEAQIPLFVERFLGGVRQTLDSQKNHPLTVNTWGDGLYFTFDSVTDANDFALDLSEFVNATNWENLGLPAELNLRIALHAGPAFEILDPVTRQKNFTGTQVSRAARMEPITPLGYVYCSESHAASVALENDGAYHCEFVGNMRYPKNYGTFPMYSLTRRKVVSE